MKNLSKRIIVGLGALNSNWQNQLKEINRLKMTEVALFLECSSELSQRKIIYQSLLHSTIRCIPLVHIRSEINKDELAFLVKKFHASYFTIHEDEFKILTKWRGFYKKLFLEMNADNFVSRSVKIDKIGGFCVDLSHFKIAEEKWSQEFEYTTKRRNTSKYFACNHLNGYSYRLNSDMHTIKSLKDFDYLKTLPSFLFGKVIALETSNSIAEQLRFKDYVVRL